MMSASVAEDKQGEIASITCQEQFEQFLEDYIKSCKSPESVCFTRERHDRLLQAVCMKKRQRFPGKNGVWFKNYAKEKFYAVSWKDDKCEENMCRLFTTKHNKMVVMKHEIYGVLKKCHEAVGHAGRRVTWKEVRGTCSGITYRMVQIFVDSCAVCALYKKRRKTRHLERGKAGRFVKKAQFRERIQADLIDFSHKPDGQYKYILHARDYFTKFSWAFPLKTKKPEETCSKLNELFCYFGAPQVLQTDNGGEFMKNAEILGAQWREMKIVRGRPCHPQSQGCVERANGDLKLKLEKWMISKRQESEEECINNDTAARKCWTRGIHEVIYAMNTSESSVTGKTPYELVFGLKARNGFTPPVTSGQCEDLNVDDMDENCDMDDNCDLNVNYNLDGSCDLDGNCDIEENSNCDENEGENDDIVANVSENEANEEYVTPQEAIREKARTTFWRNSKKKSRKHKASNHLTCKEYRIGDEVGVHVVRRQNKDRLSRFPKLERCKIVEIKMLTAEGENEKEGEDTDEVRECYRLVSFETREELNNWYFEDDLTDLRSVCFSR